MIPLGCMAKRVHTKPDRFHASHVADIYSVSNCNCEDLAENIQYWKHNGYWFFDSPDTIKENSIQLEGTLLFYYQAGEMECDGERWGSWSQEQTFRTQVAPPSWKKLKGFEVANFTARTFPECSGLSCSSWATELPTNAHCSFDSFEEAEANVTPGAFNASDSSEPGHYGIFSAYSLDWPY